MPKTEIQFLGLLANTNSTILKLKLENGFELAEVPKKDFVALIADVDGREWFETFKELSIQHYIPPDNEGDSCVVVKNRLPATIEFGSKGIPKIESCWTTMCDFHKERVKKYLERIVQLMRLFKEGTICLPVARYFCFLNGKPKLLMGAPVDSCLIMGPPYSLRKEEFAQLQMFLKETKIPFGESSMNLAHEDFELSYRVGKNHLSFLCLMIAAEVLLNPSDRELRYRVSRNTAVLLGQDHTKAATIFKEMRDLYDMRSRLVHTGNKSSVESKDVLKLRHYVRDSIKEMLRFNKSKDEILCTLNTCGFGHRPWREPE